MLFRKQSKIPKQKFRFLHGKDSAAPPNPSDNLFFPEDLSWPVARVHKVGIEFAFAGKQVENAAGPGWALGNSN
ncbi:MAG: hypothetical protein HYR56_12755 [Acidobacteria bacterium]|nr:hypothetical protein [Acidobacteriota bacterium]MBI3422301.1 hypothetical protein [Acidobacteriota bacterium]